MKMTRMFHLYRGRFPDRGSGIGEEPASAQLHDYPGNRHRAGEQLSFTVDYGYHRIANGR